MNNVARKIRRIVKSLLGKDFFPRIDHKCRRETFGSQHGAYDVAIEEEIDENTIVYSFGVGDDATFDMSLIERFGLCVHAFDPTPESIDWVKRQQFTHKFILHEYGIAELDGDVSFNPPAKPYLVSYTILSRPRTESRSITVPVKRLATIMKELGHDRIDILKMDIEGAEYRVIEDIKKSGIRPKQILVEFHHRFPNVGIKKTQKAIEDLRKMGYGLFSVSTRGEELCFLRMCS